MLHGGNAPHITDNNSNRCGQMTDAHPDSTRHTRHSSSRARQAHAARGTQLGRHSRLGRRSSAACTCTCRAPPAIHAHTLDTIQSPFPSSCSTEPKTASNSTPGATALHGTAGRCGFRQCGAVTGTDSGERGKQLAAPRLEGGPIAPQGMAGVRCVLLTAGQNSFAD